MFFFTKWIDKDTEVQVAANGDVNGGEEVILLRRSETASSIPSKNQGRTKKRPDKQVNLRRNQLGGASKLSNHHKGQFIFKSLYYHCISQ